ncbi:MAG TPA: DUF3427 domain-containing protein [Capsulimonadaceae bacterium]
MAEYSLFGAANRLDFDAILNRNPIMKRELCELLDYKLDSIAAPPSDLIVPFECPLELHAQYTRDEILAGLGVWTSQRQPPVREGVKHIPELPADVFFITLNKTESMYSPTTMYEDYAISETLFHWQSQSTTPDTSPTGARYIGHRSLGHTILLCVRENRGLDGQSAPYYFLGAADYVSHHGSRPMSMVWRLHVPMPATLVRKTATLAA